ncbi:bacteriophage holin [Prauserella cavernicola]|uniref:Bacteriophage holin n=1 Tax=Prauserella cavernicola TaxID=2800127 RepID=A0A934QPC6_9PSEU|nr:bacteriophage holin [Prauserella cavernicola]MBK1782954.1 bacteriophage holin [Prauserella cavernicola]
MYYVLSGALVGLGILVLGVVLFRIVRVLRRFTRTFSMVTVSTQDRTGLVRARTAAVRVAIGQRRARSLTQDG